MSRTVLFGVRKPFRLRQRLADLLAARHLYKRALAHIADGLPQQATFAFDHIGQEINLRGIFEREDLEALFEFLKPLLPKFKDTVALDVGANIGNHSLFFARYFKQVHAFEPNPRTFSLLQYNASLVSNITAHNLGLGAEFGTLTLHMNPGNMGEASLVAGGRPAARAKGSAAEVRIETLDSMIGQLDDVALVKIDVEGFEPQVIQGATAFIAKQRPIIVFEQNAEAFVNGRSETVELLASMGYSICIMERKNVTGTGLSGLLSVIAKKVNGIEFEFIQADSVPPKTHSMLIAIDSAALAALPYYKRSIG
jgi:FkbM family methyltransferase